jgi:hypothetical protein
VPEYVRRSVDILYPTLESEEVAYYGNVTGVVRGKWYRIPTPVTALQKEVDLGGEILPEKTFLWRTEDGNATYKDPIKGNSGRFTLDLRETKQNSTIQFVEATLFISDPSSQSMYETNLEGV